MALAQNFLVLALASLFLGYFSLLLIDGPGPLERPPARRAAYERCRKAPSYYVRARGPPFRTQGPPFPTQDPPFPTQGPLFLFLPSPSPCLCCYTCPLAVPALRLRSPQPCLLCSCPPQCCLLPPLGSHCLSPPVPRVLQEALGVITAEVSCTQCLAVGYITSNLPAASSVRGRRVPSLHLVTLAPSLCPCL